MLSWKHGFHSRRFWPWELEEMAADVVALEKGTFRLDFELALCRMTVRNLLHGTLHEDLSLSEVARSAGVLFQGVRTISFILGVQRTIDREAQRSQETKRLVCSD